MPSKLVDIAYTISDPDSTSINIGIAVSKDSGATWTVPASPANMTGTGAPGYNLPVTATPTAKAVVWNAGADWDGHFTAHCRVRIIASDNSGFIPSNTFTMGDQSGDGLSEAQAHTVTVSAFIMESTLVTGGLWNYVKEGWADINGYTFDHAGSFKDTTHPVQTINWFDAVKWCNARSEMEGLTPVYYTTAEYTEVYKTGQLSPAWKPGANGYRLPTEAEWEKAARGGQVGKRFPWDDTITHSQANYYSSSSYSYDTSPTRGYHPTYGTGAQPYTSPVGSFAANGYGLFDMAGNVFHWCWDWYGTYPGSGGTDPQGPASGSYRVLRGGSWYFNAYYCRSASRFNNGPTYADNDFGFRVVRSP